VAGCAIGNAAHHCQPLAALSVKQSGGACKFGPDTLAGVWAVIVLQASQSVLSYGPSNFKGRMRPRFRLLQSFVDTPADM
jgi:hypothetical protein